MRPRRSDGLVSSNPEHVEGANGVSSNGADGGAGGAGRAGDAGVHGHAEAHGNGSHGHTHAVTSESDHRYLTITLALLASFLVFEVVTAFLSHSLALLADAGHMLADVGAIAGSLASRCASPPGLRRAHTRSA